MNKKWIKRLFIPLCVTIIAAILSIILASKQHYCSPTSRALIETILIIILPIFPVIYGLKLRDRAGSILIGILPFSVILIIILGELLLSSNYTPGVALRTISYWFILISIAGLEGYFASKGKGSLIIAIALLITWYIWFLSGILYFHHRLGNAKSVIERKHDVSMLIRDAGKCFSDNNNRYQIRARIYLGSSPSLGTNSVDKTQRYTVRYLTEKVS